MSVKLGRWKRYENTLDLGIDGSDFAVIGQAPSGFAWRTLRSFVKVNTVVGSPALTISKSVLGLLIPVFHVASVAAADLVAQEIPLLRKANITDSVGTRILARRDGGTSINISLISYVVEETE